MGSGRWVVGIEKEQSMMNPLVARDIIAEMAQAMYEAEVALLEATVERLPLMEQCQLITIGMEVAQKRRDRANERAASLVAFI